MPITFAQGFKIATQEPIDTRFLLTKAEMAALLKGNMPDKYFCICKDDGKLYIWDSSFEKREDIGRFKSYEELIDVPAALAAAIESSMEQLTEQFSKVVPGALKVALEGQAKDSGLVVDNDGNIALSYNEDLLKLSENKLDLNVEVIQAI